jgi:hypothetical protein
MAAPTLEEVQRVAEQLSTADQARLLEYLAPRIVQALASTQAGGNQEPPKPESRDAHTEAWRRFVRIGEAIAASAPPDAESMTAAVLKMRRSGSS